MRNKRSELKAKDVLISCVGANIGHAAFVPPDIEKANIVRNVALLRSKDKSFKNSYILSYFLSKYGKNLFIRVATGNAQPLVSLDNIKEIIIPCVSEELQGLIDNVVENSVTLLAGAKKLLENAQSLLLSELGLTNWRPKHQISFVKKYSDTEQAGRIDAEYYQPKYEEIVKAIQNYSGGWDTLGNLVTVKKCVEVGSDEYHDEGIRFVRVSDISPFEITEEKYISEKLYQKIKQHQPQKGEILFSKDASPGTAYYLNESPQKMIPSGGILRLKNKSDKINNEYLTLVLNSILTKEQVNRDVGGSVILHWRPDQVKETVIPILSDAKQAQVQQKVTESFNLRKQSKHLLGCSKRAVEMAIEQDEQKAINWLKEQTRDIGVMDAD